VCKLTLPLLLALSGCATLKPPADWSRRDTVLELTYQFTAAMDARTTAHIHDATNVTEGGALASRVLGPYPDPSETAVYFATTGLVHYLISRYLPHKLRPYWQGATTAYEAALVLHNCEIDLCGN
jgi:hypothetical protein